MSIQVQNPPENDPWRVAEAETAMRDGQPLPGGQQAALLQSNMHDSSSSWKGSQGSTEADHLAQSICKLPYKAALIQRKSNSNRMHLSGMHAAH